MKSVKIIPTFCFFFHCRGEFKIVGALNIVSPIHLLNENDQRDHIE